MLAVADRGDAPLARGTWWRMLAHSARYPKDEPPQAPDEVRALLIGAGVLPQDEPRSPAETVPWAELARDLDRLRALGLRVPQPVLSRTAQREECRRRFATSRPSQELNRLAHRRKPPDVADACLAIADLCGP